MSPSMGSLPLIAISPGASESVPTKVYELQKSFESKSSGMNGFSDVTSPAVVKEKRILTFEEILKHNTEVDAWIVVDRKVYDVTSFLGTHPGGAELLLEHLNGKDVGELMRGKESEDDHSHSKSAFGMLEQFLIGTVEETGRSSGDSGERKPADCTTKFAVDLTKPLVAQVGYLGSEYDKWVHDPIVCKESPRFFESDFVESLTRTHWWVIPIVWIPVVVWMEKLALKHGVESARLPGLIFGGVLIWTLVEYILHRFLFHMKTSSYWSNTAHYLLHGFHHKHPMDGARLVMPPAFTLVFVVTIWTIIGNWVAPFPIKCSMFGGALLAYVGYDLTHYFLHFGVPFNDHTRKMKAWACVVFSACGQRTDKYVERQRFL